MSQLSEIRIQNPRFSDRPFCVTPFTVLVGRQNAQKDDLAFMIQQRAFETNHREWKSFSDLAFSVRREEFREVVRYGFFNIFVQNLDSGLHPMDQADLMNEIREAMKAHPEIQILAITNSPYLVDLCMGDEVLVLVKDPDEVTHMRTLIEAPGYERFQHALQTGEIWAHVWEDWVLPKV